MAWHSDLSSFESPMQPIKLSAKIILWPVFLIFFICVVPVVPVPTPAAPSTERVELTRKDLFEAVNWDSTHVDVLGFHLGMTRHEANDNAHRNGLSLVIPDVRGAGTCSGEKCELCDAKFVCPGIMLDFAHDDKIVGIDILRIQDAAAVVQKAAIINRFKGKTSLLFNHYSNDLRLKLLGHEDSREQPSDKNPLYQGMMTYKYLRLGVTVFVSPNPHGPESTSDLVISFVAPVVHEPT
jgi:hypothetical protein